MPVTPFHFGPGALLHATAPRHVSFLASCPANGLNRIVSVDLLHSLHLGSGAAALVALMTRRLMQGSAWASRA